MCLAKRTPWSLRHYIALKDASEGFTFGNAVFILQNEHCLSNRANASSFSLTFLICSWAALGWRLAFIALGERVYIAKRRSTVWTTQENPTQEIALPREAEGTRMCESSGERRKAQVERVHGNPRWPASSASRIFSEKLLVDAVRFALP